MFGIVGPPPTHPGRWFPFPLGNVGKRFGTESGAARTHPPGFVAPKMFGKCQGNIQGLWGAPPQPLPGLVVHQKRFGKCWGNVDKEVEGMGESVIRGKVEVIKCKRCVGDFFFIL